MGKKTIIWLSILILIAACLAGGYYFLTISKRADQAWNPLSEKCHFKMDIPQKTKDEITTIVTSVANKGYLSLLGDQGHLNRLGDMVDEEIDTLHFWAYIFSQKTLAADMKKIQSSSLKYNHFIENSRKGFLKIYNTNKCFYSQVEGFAAYLKIDKEKTVEIMKECIEKAESSKEAFKPFIDYLIKEKS